MRNAKLSLQKFDCVVELIYQKYIYLVIFRNLY